MDQKIKDLTEKLYREGVEAGESKAESIIREAGDRAAEILADARGEAGRIVAAAEKEASELKRNMEADLKLSAGQAMNALKQQIADALLCAVVDKPVGAGLAEPETIKDFLRIIIQNWHAAAGEAPRLDVLLPEGRRAELEGALKQGLQSELGRGLELRFAKSIKAGFQIRPQNSTFKISLTDEDFKEFFREYLRPKTRAFLFGE